MKYSHLTLHLSLQVLDDFLLLEESLLELIRPLGLLGRSPGNLAQSSLQEANLSGGKQFQSGLQLLHNERVISVEYMWALFGRMRDFAQ